MVDNILCRYLEKRGVSFDRNEVKKTLQQHPDYPQLLSVMDTLDFLNIAHSVYKCDITELDQEINCFISPLIDDRGYTELSLIEIKKKKF